MVPALDVHRVDDQVPMVPALDVHRVDDQVPMVPASDVEPQLSIDQQQLGSSKCYNVLGKEERNDSSDFSEAKKMRTNPVYITAPE